MKSTQSEPRSTQSQSEQKSLGATKNQHAEEPGQKSKNQSTENVSKTGAKDMKAEGHEQKSPGATKSQRAEEPGQKSKNQSTENESKTGAKDIEGHDKNMKAEGREGQDKNMKAEGREGRDTNAQRTDERSQTTTGQAGRSAKLTTEQRTRITTVIHNEHVAPATNVDFAISVGTRVPRERVSLRPLPAEVISIYPEWRGYEFFLVRDQIVVVDPRTGEIVDVIPA